jgi:hypothetical protein
MIMIAKVARIGALLAILGCGGEPERSRAVPASTNGKDAVGEPPRPAPGDIRKIEMH